jgi:hypothetical protein
MGMLGLRDESELEKYVKAGRLKPVNEHRPWNFKAEDVMNFIREVVLDQVRSEFRGVLDQESEQLVTYNAAADYLEVLVVTIRKLVSKEELVRVIIGNKRYVTVSSLQDYKRRTRRG